MKKIRIIVFALSLWSLSLQAQSCPPGNIELSTQAQVDSFPINYPNCHSIMGDLLIGSDTFTNCDIVNLDALTQLTAIAGTLRITYTNLLTSLSGLSNLDTVGYEVYVGNNGVLSSLEGLSEISSLIAGPLRINDNPALTSLDGFNNLTYLEGVQIVNNSGLTSVNGLNGLKRVMGGISIGFNNLLLHLDAFHSLDSIGLNGLIIYQNQNLVALDAFEKLSFIRTDLEVNYNNSLVNLSGLDSLCELLTVNIVANPSFTSLAGLGKIDTIRELYIHDNDALLHLNGLSSLTSVGDLSILYNNGLVDLQGLEHLSTVTNRFNLISNEALTSLSGLENLLTIENLSIKSNPLLSDISGFQKLNLIGTLDITSNPQLSECSIYAVCKLISQQVYFLNIGGNSMGCNTVTELEEGCGAIPVYASVKVDNNGDCIADNNDLPVSSITVGLSGALQINQRPTASNGIVRFGLFDNAPFILQLPQYPTSNWAVCQDSFMVDPNLSTDTIRRTFLLQAQNDCPELSVELGMPPFFRGCLASTPVNVSVTNTGTISAEGVIVAVVLPPQLELLASTPPLMGQSGDTLYFEVGSLAIFEVSVVQLSVHTVCDSFLLGETLCLEALADLDNSCSTSAALVSEIRLFSQCIGDSIVRFTIKNVGNAATLGSHEYVIIEDEIIMRTQDFSLNPFAAMTVDVPTDGSTYRMEATKYDNGALTATARENCGGLTPGFVTAFWFDRSLRNYDFDCREVNLAYDPNQKSAVPTGIGSHHLIVANQPLEYMIEFQNTGNDTAFNVKLLDVLPPQLDEATFRPGFASNPYTWEIIDGTLAVLFSAIALPDSNVNEAASHGFFTFTIDQKPNLPDGTSLKNEASIIFDYNPPIVTNQVVHTIGKLMVSADEPQQYASLWRVMGNPTSIAAIFYTNELIVGEKSFELTDIMGHLIHIEHFEGQSFEFQRGALSGGVYFFRIADVKGRVFTGKIVIAD